MDPIYMLNDESLLQGTTSAFQNDTVNNQDALIFNKNINGEIPALPYEYEIPNNLYINNYFHDTINNNAYQNQPIDNPFYQDMQTNAFIKPTREQVHENNMIANFFDQNLMPNDNPQSDMFTYPYLYNQQEDPASEFFRGPISTGCNFNLNNTYVSNGGGSKKKKNSNSASFHQFNNYISYTDNKNKKFPAPLNLVHNNLTSEVPFHNENDQDDIHTQERDLVDYNGLSSATLPPSDYQNLEDITNDPMGFLENNLHYLNGLAGAKYGKGNKAKIDLKASKLLFRATEDGKYKCFHCAKIIARKNSFKRHLFSHFKISLYSCNVCNKQFSRSDVLKKHTSLQSCKPGTRHSKRYRNSPC